MVAKSASAQSGPQKHGCPHKHHVPCSYSETVLKHAHNAKDAVSNFGKEKLPGKVTALASKVKDAAKVHHAS